MEHTNTGVRKILTHLSLLLVLGYWGIGGKKWGIGVGYPITPPPHYPNTFFNYPDTQQYQGGLRTSKHVY